LSSFDRALCSPCYEQWQAEEKRKADRAVTCDLALLAKYRGGHISRDQVLQSACNTHLLAQIFSLEDRKRSEAAARGKSKDAFRYGDE